MSRWLNIGTLPPAMRAQAEAQLRKSASVRDHLFAKSEKLLMPDLPKPTKYNARKCVYDGQKFDSLKEAGRWRDLRLMAHAGEIERLSRQVTFELRVGEHRITTYRADFVYWRRNGHRVVEDVKGYRKGQAYQVFKIKAALMLALHRITVVEI